MTSSQHYTYSILRYRHDSVLGESLNVGVVLFSKEVGQFKFKFNKKITRLKSAFPSLDPISYRSTIRVIEKGLSQFTGFSPKMMSPSAGGVREIVEKVLRQDDSSFHWSHVGEGITSDIEDEIQFLFRRFVTWNEEINPSRRSDSDVWRPVQKALKRKKLINHFEETKIESDLAEVKFDHAWKNGRWHVFQPLSLDLKTEDGIHDKVAKWSGYLLHLESEKTRFKPYFLLGKPQDPKLGEIYQDMIEALKKSPCNPEVYPEHKTDDLIDYIEDQIKSHDDKNRIRGIANS